MFWLAPTASRERIATTTTEITRGTLHKRTQIWKAGVFAAKQRPLVGVGAGAYPDAVRPWLGVPPIPGHEYVAHNTFLSVFVETGIAGAALYAALLVTFAAFVWVLPYTHRMLWATTLLVWAIGATTLTWEQRKPWWLMLGLVMAQWARTFRPEGLPK
jgi:O-antigen ligase